MNIMAVRTAREAADYKKLSERDLMTGLYNRGSFEKYVKLQLNEVGGGTSI